MVWWHYMLSTIMNSKTKGKYVFLLFALCKYSFIEIVCGLHIFWNVCQCKYLSYERDQAGEMHFNLQNHVHQFVSSIETLSNLYYFRYRFYFLKLQKEQFQHIFPWKWFS